MPALEYQINNSVGRPSRGAANELEDVETVQNMLRLVAMIENQPQFDPGGVDGTIENESNDDTIRAIEAFQARFSSKPDGVIDVGKRTWRNLIDLLEGDETDSQPATVPVSAIPATNGQCFFPFTQVPDENWTEGIRRFGARRSKGKRAHAGCDLYFPVGTTIHAIASGTVTRGPYAFYDGTFALEIDHGAFLARYGEIQGNTFVNEGDQVTAGQQIARVGKLGSIKQSMLHLELYDKSAQGGLTVTNAATKKTADGIPYMRRSDLFDPTEKLNEWRNNLPS
jgi:murein DD-endopeptidase MepM/ murein hydrolase activator NlpD